jgi:hypothetical protein
MNDLINDPGLKSNLIDLVSSCHGLKAILMLLQLFKFARVAIKALANLFP